MTEKNISTKQNNKYFMLFTKKLILILLIFCFLSCNTGKKAYYAAKEQQSIDLYESFIEKYPKSKLLDSAKAELWYLYEERDWNIAKETHQIDTYNRFIEQYPESKHITEAKKNIYSIKEENLWNKAMKINAVDSYEYFIESFPESKYVAEAKKRIHSIKEQKAWQSALSDKNLFSYRKFISDFPLSTKVPEAQKRINEIDRKDWESAYSTFSISAFDYYLSRHPQGLMVNEAFLLKQKIYNTLDSLCWFEASKKYSLSLFKIYKTQFMEGKYWHKVDSCIQYLEEKSESAEEYRNHKFIFELDDNKRTYILLDSGFRTTKKSEMYVLINKLAFREITQIYDEKLEKIYISADIDKNAVLSWYELEVFQKKLYNNYTYFICDTIIRPDRFIKYGGGKCDDWSLMTAGLLRFWNYQPFIARFGRTKVVGHACCIVLLEKPYPRYYLTISIPAGYENIPEGTYTVIDYDAVGDFSTIDRRWKISDIYVPEDLYQKLDKKNEDLYYY